MSLLIGDVRQITGRHLPCSGNICCNMLAGSGSALIRSLRFYLVLFVVSWAYLMYLPSSVIASATLATLAILAFSLIRDRSDRTQLLQQIVALIEQSKQHDLDAIFYQPVDEGPLLESAEKEIWLVLETGLYIIESKSGIGLLRSFLPPLLRNGSPISLIPYHNHLKMWLNMLHFVIYR